jgi:hypothetical protein
MAFSRLYVKSFIFLSILALPVSSFGQTIQWDRTENWSSNNYGLNAQVDDAGYVYYIGFYSKYNGWDPNPEGGFVSKYDQFGTNIWSDTFSLVLYDGTTDTAGNSYVVGYYGMKKFNAMGNQVWSFPMQGVMGAIDCNRRGDIYVAGTYNGSITLGSITLTGGNAFIGKMTPSGGFTWATNVWNSGYWENIHADEEGNVFLTSTWYVKKYDSTGTLKWTKVLPSGCFLDDVYSDGRGGIYACGHFEGTIAFDNINATTSTYGGFLLTRLDSSGNFLWVTYPPSASDGMNLTVRGNNIYAIGMYVSQSMTIGNVTSYSTNNPGRQFFMSKFDTTGNCLSIDNFPPYCEYHADDGGMVADNNGIYFAYAQCGDRLHKYAETITLINEELQTNALSVFPVPAHGSINILYKGGSGKIKISITDALGKTIMNGVVEFDGNYSSTVDVSSLAKGMYLLQVQNDKSVLSRKILIQ